VGINVLDGYVNKAKQYLVLEEFKKALELLDNALLSNPDNKDLIKLKNRVEEAEKKCREVEEFWEKFVITERYARSGLADTKTKCKEALVNYYLKLDDHAEDDSPYSEKMDIAELVNKVYTSWKQGQDGAENRKNNK